MKYVIYDLEIFKNLFTYTDKHRDSEEITQFVIHQSKDQRKELYEYLSQKLYMIGFNNLKFDYPLLHFMLTNKSRLMTLSVEKLLLELYRKAQDIIDAKYSSIPHWKVMIPQLDLFSINHFDNAAKRTSLKDLEFYMHMDNIESLPFKHNELVNDVQKVLDYNLNDVVATEKFYHKNIDAIKMRVELSRNYSIDLLNANDPQIGSEIFINFIAKKTNQDVKDLKQLRTKRDKIHLGDLILPYVKYQSKEFNEVLERIQNTTVADNSTFSERVILNGFPYDFGVGGIHGCTYSGTYRPKEHEIIKTSDVTSYYPNLGIRNKRYPLHLGPVFYEIYEEIYDTRAMAKKNGFKAINEGLKLALNGVYGLEI